MSFNLKTFQHLLKLIILLYKKPAFSQFTKMGLHILKINYYKKMAHFKCHLKKCFNHDCSGQTFQV